MNAHPQYTAPVLAPLDIAVIVAWLALSFGAGLWFSRRASASTEDFFVAGRSLPWWIVGTSMVATTFAADTPLAVSGWVASDMGIAKNWIWWTFGLTGSVAVFLFAPLWRRAQILTDAELVELRYGPKAAWLRGAKALWFGVFWNALVMAWVIKAMVKILGVVAGWPPHATVQSIFGVGLPWVATLPASTVLVAGLFAITVVYTAASGLWGVIATDMAQFALAMVGSVGLAILAWRHVGGLAGLQQGFVEHGFDWQTTTALLPLGDASPDGVTAAFAVLVGVLWWTGMNVDGGSYLAQRLFAAKDDRHALWAYLWFTVAHIVLRPWPWIVVGLVGMATLGKIEDPETYYPTVMAALLPAGFFGLMVASFLAAFMSTVDTHLNWGASLMVNDVYVRFIRPQASQVEQVRASRIAITLLAAVGAAASFLITDIGSAWTFAISVTAGLGAVYIARWYWWRTNAWSEVAAMATAATLTAFFTTTAPHHPEAVQLAITAAQSPEALAEVVAPWAWLAAVPVGWLAFPFSAGFTAMVALPIWLGVTLLTPPAPRETLEIFYARVRPGGIGWRKIAGDRARADGPSKRTLVAILGSVSAIYSALLGFGWLMTGHLTWAAASGVVCVIGVAVLSTSIHRLTMESP